MGSSSGTREKCLLTAEPIMPKYGSASNIGAGHPTIVQICYYFAIRTTGTYVECRGLPENTRFIKSVEELFNRLANNEVSHESLSLKMQRLVDGKGAERIAFSLMTEMAINHNEKYSWKESDRYL